jgi:hypothetical protein
MEYAEKGDVLKRIEEHQKRGTHFEETELWSVLV